MRCSLLVLMCTLFLSNNVFADSTCQSTYGPYGPVTCGAGTTVSISANGPVTLNHTTVQQGTSINGVLSATQATLNAITDNGSVDLLQSTVAGQVMITGALTATKTVFNNSITIATDNAVFADCQTKDIIVKSGSDGVTSPQRIVLTGNTQINGNISFSDNDGIVTADPDVKITGKVLGGQLVRKNLTNKVEH